MRELATFTHTVLPSEMALELLFARFSGSPMLPNIRSIEWFGTEEERHTTLILPLLVSPLLTNFYYYLEDTSHTRAIVSALTPACNSLRSIIIVHSSSHPGPESPDLVQESSALLLKCGSDQFRTFVIGSPLSWKAFLRASQLPSLQCFAVRPDWTEPLSNASLPAAMFPSIQHLCIEVHDADSVWLQFLARISSNGFYFLTIELRNAAAATIGLPAALKHLRSAGLHTTLTKMVIYPQGDSRGLEVGGTIIEHLLPLNQLEELDISFICNPAECCHKLSDEDIEKLVKGMPKLEYLALGDNLCCGRPDNSIKNLTAIANHCKYLKGLRIHINAEAVIAGTFDRDEYADEEPVPRQPVECPLLTITFGTSAILTQRERQRDAKALASKLSQLFPHLIEAKTADERYLIDPYL